MGLFALIKSLFGGKPKRDISRLAPGEDAGPADAVTELVDVSGGPLKQNGHRRALRDKRLLPKSKSVSRQLGFTKRKAIMPKREADRLFAGTMRTRNRSLRDLLPDEEQLKRYGLPVWKTEADLAKTLGISESELWFFGIHRERERHRHYVTFAIRKRTGGKR